MDIVTYALLKGKGGGGGGADWNASEGEDGYVKNRPFYESKEPITPPGGSPLSFTISSDDLEPLPMSGMYQLPSDISGALSGILIEWDQTPLYGSGYARVSLLGYNFDLEYWSDNLVPVGDASGTFVDDPDEPLVGLGAVAFGVDTMSYLMGDFGSVPSGTPITIELVTDVLQKVPEKYLPDPVFLYGDKDYGGWLFKRKEDYSSSTNPLSTEEFIEGGYYDAFISGRLFVAYWNDNPDIPISPEITMIVSVEYTSGSNYALNSNWYTYTPLDNH